MKYRVSSPYGMRALNGETAMHKGIDIVYEDGFVRAFADGIVQASLIIRDKKNKTWEWGEYIRVEGDGKKYYYCHMKERFAKVGDEIKAGDILGIMGSTGKSTAPHTHFEIRDYFGDSINPTTILSFMKNVRGTYEFLTDVIEKIKEVVKVEEVKKDEVAEWAKVSWNKAVAKKILDGTRPTELMTRQELACVLDRLGLLK